MHVHFALPRSRVDRQKEGRNANERICRRLGMCRLDGGRVGLQCRSAFAFAFALWWLHLCLGRIRVRGLSAHAVKFTVRGAIQPWVGKVLDRDIYIVS